MNKEVTTVIGTDGKYYVVLDGCLVTPGEAREFADRIRDRAMAASLSNMAMRANDRR